MPGTHVPDSLSNRSALNLLLLSSSRAWTSAVRSAASDIGAEALEVTRSAAEAIRRLAMPQQTYSHLLLEPFCAGALASELVGMTSGDAGSGTGLVMLGKTGTAPPHVPVVAEASRAQVSRALAGGGDAAPPRPPLKLDELRAALSGAMIQTRYQPVVRMDDRAPEMVEVLARLDHPRHGIMEPGLFVPPMEHAGLAAELTRLVVSRALADISVAEIARHKLRVALNFPLDVLLLPDAIGQLDAQRAAVGLAAERVTIELTESRPVEDVPALARALERLRGLGYGLAIDDVGPGVPHLNALLDLPFTALKIDMDVVQLASTSPSALDFVVRTIAGARARGLSVVAEGVESQETWDRMASLGADQAQGFLIARPLPATALALWLEAWT